MILHLLASYSAEVDLSIDDFAEINLNPPLADVKPFGKYSMNHLIRIGGIRPMMKMLLDRGLLHSDCLTVTGETVAESLKDVSPYGSFPDEQDIIYPWDSPIKSSTHLRILRGNLAPDAAVGKITGRSEYFKGTAKVYEGESLHSSGFAAMSSLAMSL